VEILKWFREAVRRKGPELLPGDWIIHHYTATAHKALLLKQFLAQKSITEMVLPPYFPPLAPKGFWLFPKMSALKGRRFQDSEHIQRDVTAALKAIPQQQFQKCFKHWQHRWAK
jgi:hypothetical protein